MRERTFIGNYVKAFSPILLKWFWILILAEIVLARQFQRAAIIKNLVIDHFSVLKYLI